MRRYLKLKAPEGQYFILAGSPVSEVPREIQILSLGHWEHPKQGPFDVTTDTVRQCVNNFRTSGRDVVIDYEHQTLSGKEAPAAGWIKEMINKGGEGLWGIIEWTDKAREYIRGKEYRFQSPVLLLNSKSKTSGERIGAVIHSAGLTNSPFVDGLQPIINKEEVKSEMNFLQKIKELFGLTADTATEDDALQAVTGLTKFVTAIKEALGLQADASQTQVEESISGLKKAKASGTPPGSAVAEKVVAAKEVLTILELKEDATVDDIRAKVVALKNPSQYVSKQDFEKLESKLALKDRDELVAQAIAQGKVTPAQKDWAQAYALKDPAGFKAYVEKSPQVVPLNKIDKPAPLDPTRPDETQVFINKQLGIDAATFKKYAGEETV